MLASSDTRVAGTFFALLKNLAGLSDFFTLSSGSCDKWEGGEISGALCNLPSARELELRELDSDEEGGSWGDATPEGGGSMDGAERRA